MSINRLSAGTRRQIGLSLIELIVFIMIVSVALVALLRVLNVTAQHNADPMITKQMQAIAEAYIEEVSSMPFTWCDPEDAQVLTAQNSSISSNGCAAYPEAIGPETIAGQGVEVRGGTPPFNNVNDYGPTYGPNTPVDASGTHTFNGYKVTVYVAADTANLGPAGKQIQTSDLLHITVVVANTSGSNSLTLEAYRARYAPNTVQ